MFVSKCLKSANFVVITAKRFKQHAQQYQGVKGIRNRKNFYHNNDGDDSNNNDKDTFVKAQETLAYEQQNVDMDDLAYDEVVGSTMHVERNILNRAQNVIIIQPYVKWCPQHKTNEEIIKMSADSQLREAEALIKSLPNWHVALSLKVPLERLERKMLFGSGKLLELKEKINNIQQQQQNTANMLFVSKGQLTYMQKSLLEREFNLPIMDRYSIVIQILRLHATSAEARLQVAMAEIPYIWSQAKDLNNNSNSNNNNKRQAHYYSLTDTQRDLLKNREKKLRIELGRIRNQRKLLRNKRQQNNYPVIAVVGYTNAGKTSLIKALTQEEKLQPKNQLFATLDVTAHSGMLPCSKLQVIYMDTIGFMSDLPTGLFECFIATLEDVMLADVIVHVQDVSHDCWLAQSQHVKQTLMNLAKSTTTTAECLPPIINVGNKMDLLKKINNNNNIDNEEKNLVLISSLKNIGLYDVLKAIEDVILKSTNRRRITIRVPNGGSEMSWLYKNAAIVDIRTDVNSAEHLYMQVVITDIALQQFKRNLCSNSSSSS